MILRIAITMTFCNIIIGRPVAPAEGSVPSSIFRVFDFRARSP